MKVLLVGATGMIGQGVLRECLLDSEVELVQTLGRTPTGVQHPLQPSLQTPKIREIVHRDMFHLERIERELSGLDACFFCLGVSSAGMTASDYERVTYQLTTAVAETLSRLNPRMTFIYVSGAGTDSSEQGKTRWARVKGKTENALLRLPFKAAYMFRPGFIQPLSGIRSKTRSYRIFYAAVKPLWPFLRWAFPNSILTTEDVGRAMLAAAKHGAPKAILESKDIKALSSG